MREEKKVRLLQEAICHGNKGRATALFTTLNNPPCILHMHNIIALKKLTVIFEEWVVECAYRTFGWQAVLY
jgi:hypothetical protein